MFGSHGREMYKVCLDVWERLKRAVQVCLDVWEIWERGV